METEAEGFCELMVNRIIWEDRLAVFTAEGFNSG
jgi:hypothetical protein